MRSVGGCREPKRVRRWIIKNVGIAFDKRKRGLLHTVDKKLIARARIRNRNCVGNCRRDERRQSLKDSAISMKRRVERLDVVNRRTVNRALANDIHRIEIDADSLESARRF